MSPVSIMGGAAGAALLLNLLGTFILIRVSHHRKWYDVQNHRKIHNGDIPRIGGIGFFSVALAVWLGMHLLPATASALPPLQLRYWIVFLTGLLVVHVSGILDDFTDIRPRFKLIVQVVAAGAVIAFGFYFRSVSLPLVHAKVELGWFGPLLTFLWIIGVSNAVNLIDGLDGLAGSLNLLILLFFGLFALHAGSLSLALLCFSFAGALLAFLVFNLPPASIFMGDSGSLMLGFLLAVMPLAPIGAEFGPKMLPFIFSLVLVPVYDTIAAIVRRSLQGKPFYTPDKGHIHHKLLSLGCSNRAILLILGAITISLGVIAYLWIALDAALLLDILPALWLLYALALALLVRRFRARQLHPSP